MSFYRSADTGLKFAPSTHNSIVAMTLANARVPHLVALLTLLQTALVANVDAERRPFYIIGNMVNSLEDVDIFLNAGANAIEATVKFNQNGRATYFFHGSPCDCFRSCSEYSTIEDYLKYLRRVTSPNGGKFHGQLALLYLTLKTSELRERSQYQAGVGIARRLMTNLWKEVSPADAVPVLVYVSNTHQKKVFKGVLDTITAPWRNHIGFDIGGMESFTKIGEVFAELNITKGRWLGSGNTNCRAYSPGTYERLQAIIDCREGHIPGCDVVDKGYAWNVDKTDSIAREIRLGLDGVITNYPSHARRALDVDDIRRIVRLARPSDSPWERIRN